jgi:ectoine hydroxylase-related dioxygenase (phytanoyl-CoA dioxygenase family)
MSTATAFQVTDEQKKQFRERGYFILERVIPDEHLELLRGECQHFINRIHDEMDAKRSDVLGINHRNKRYFINAVYKERQQIGDFIFSELMAEICRSTLGPDAYLFWDQYVVKGAEVGMKFGWHQDSGYVGHPHRPYLTCWCALDDVNEANGTVYVLPYERAGTREIVQHVREEGSNDLVGYHGKDPGDPVIVPAGSIAVFSSVTFHRSGANTTRNMRRVYVAQYSGEVVMNKEGTAPNGEHVPFLNDGKRVS